MSARNKFLIVLAIILAIASGYYLISTPGGKDLVLVGTVDANQIVVSPQMQGRITKLLVEEGSQVKQGDLIALLDPSELEAQEPADDWTRQGRRGVRAGEGAGGDESEGATGERAGAEGSGGGGSGGLEFGDCANESGDGSSEYGGIDAGTGG